METSFPAIKEHIDDCERVELFTNEKIIKLNIRFGELYHICQGSEWDDFFNFLKEKNIKIKINKWYEFWDR